MDAATSCKIYNSGGETDGSILLSVVLKVIYPLVVAHTTIIISRFQRFLCARPATDRAALGRLHAEYLSTACA